MLSAISSGFPPTVRLSADEAPSATAPIDAAPKKHPSGATHLFIVEDTSNMLARIKGLLSGFVKENNLKVIECVQGNFFREKLAQLQDDEKALVVLDGNMPVESGLDALQLLQQEPKLLKRINAVYFNSGDINDLMKLVVLDWHKATKIPVQFAPLHWKTDTDSMISFFNSEVVIGKSTGKKLAGKPVK